MIYQKANKDQFAYHIAEARKTAEAKKKAKAEIAGGLKEDGDSSSVTASTLQTPSPALIENDPSAVGINEKEDDVIEIDSDDDSQQILLCQLIISSGSYCFQKVLLS